MTDTHTHENHAVAKLARHETELHVLNSRVSSVEEGVKRLDLTMSAGFEKIGLSFSDLKTLVVEQRARTGPGWKEILGGIIAIGAAFSVMATAITMIVSSTLGPQLTGLEKTISVHDKTLDMETAEHRQELTSLRAERKSDVDKQLDHLSAQVEKLTEKLSWSARVERP